MNQGLYRVVFNAARGIRMVVQECARSHGGAAAGDSACQAQVQAQASGRPPVSIGRLCALAAALVWLGQPAQAQIVADPSAPGNQRPTVLANPDGVPLINIQTPSAAGVSRNTYRQFDVQTEGAILNNSRGSNPWLARGEARVILNEVNSSQPSHLGGTVTVNGGRADVIIANPAGIQADGARFVNASRVTLTSGTARLENGDIKGFDVRAGAIEIGGKGLDVKGVPYTEILGRAANIAGKVEAGSGQLAVVTGTQRIDYGSGATQAIGGSGSKPAVAIDTAALGGMYAGRITLLATEAGVGVRNAGTLKASGQLVVTADGRLENRGTLQAQEASVASVRGNIDNSGKLLGGHLLLASAGADFNHSGTGLQQATAVPSNVIVHAQRDVKLAANARIASTGSKASQPEAGSGTVSISAGRNIQLASGSRIEARGDLQLSSEGTVTADKATVLSTTAAAGILSASGIRLTDSTVTGQQVHLETGAPFRETAADIGIKGGQIHGARQTAAIASGSLVIDSPGIASVRSDGGHVFLQAGKDLRLTAGTHATAAGHFTAHAAGALRLEGAGGATPANGKRVSIDAKGDVTLSGDGVALQGSRVHAQGALAITAYGESGVSIHALPTVVGNVYDHDHSRVQLDAGKNMEVSAYQGGVSAHGVVAGGQNINILGLGPVAIGDAFSYEATQEVAIASQIRARSDLNIGSIGTDQNVTLSASTFSAGGSLQLQAGRDINLLPARNEYVVKGQQGPVYQTVGTAIEAADIRLQAGRNLHTQSAGIKATSGHLALAAEKGSLSLKNPWGDSPALTASGNVYLHAAQAVDVNATALKAGGSMAITSAEKGISANKATLAATDLLSLSSKGAQNHSAGNYQAGALSVYNQGGTLTLNNTLLQTSATSSAATKAVSGQLSVESGGAMKANAGTSFKAATDLSIVTGLGDITLYNFGNLKLGLAVDADELALSQSQISAKRDLTIVARSGTLELIGRSVGTANAPSALPVTLNAPRHLTLGGAAVSLQGSKLTSKGDLNITAHGGNILIDGIRSDFTAHVPKDRVAQLQKERAEIEKQIGQIKSDPAYATMVAEVSGLRKQEVHFCFYMNDAYACEQFESLLAAAEKRIQPYRNQIASLEQERGEFDKYIGTLNASAHGSKNFGAQLTGKNIRLTASQGIGVYGAALTASEQVHIQAAGALPADPNAPSAEQKKAVGIHISGLSDLYEYGQAGSNQYAWALFGTPSVIQGSKGVQIETVGSGNSRLVLSDSHVKAPNGTVRLQSQGDLRLESGQEEIYSYHQFSYKRGKWYNRKRITETHINQDISASPVQLSGQHIELKSGGSIAAYATQFDAPQGHIQITAANALNLYAVPEVQYSQVDVQKKKSFLGVTYGRDKTVTSREVSAQLPSKLVAGSASTASGWDTLLQGTAFQTSLSGANIQVGVGANARADAKVILEGIKTRVTQSHVRESNYVVWQRQTGRGSTVETLTLPSFGGPGAPTFKGPVLAQVPAGDFKTEVQALAEQPGMAYLGELTKRSDVDWQSVKLAYDQWSYKQEGLTPAGAALLAVAVAVVTNGVGSDLVGASGQLGSAMADAAFSSLAAQASITLVNNKGNLGKTLQALASSDTVRATIAAMLTAGVLEKIGGLDSIRPLKGSQAFSDKLTFNLVNASGRALTNAAINGGGLEEALRDALLGAVVDTAHGEVAGQIKLLESEYIAHKLAHALAGCAAAASAQGSCRDGAIGSAVGEMVAELLQGEKPAANASAEAKQAYENKVLAYSKLVAGTAAAYAGGDAQTAITTAEVTVKYNYLSRSPYHEVKGQIAKENVRLMQDCFNGNSCTEARLREIDSYLSQLEYVLTTAHIVQRGEGLTKERAKLISQFFIEIAPGWGTTESAMQLMTGRSSLTKEEASRFWASMGLVPVIGGAIRRVGEPSVDAIVEVLRTSGGTANNVTAIRLAEQLRLQNLEDISSRDPRLAIAVRGGTNGSVNFSIGTSSAAEASRLGQIWVGDGARPLNGVPGGWISADGERVYRPPTLKPNTPAIFNPTGLQANFQTRNPKTGGIISNGHMVIK
ncbi:filamentous hemagglutinin N-terminal domain-containing protein [Corticibacter populi]|uniref:Filamentous hemagglutinin N-terminal domain-containing protein n=1 Tax=Corticibacter populi TaxID=1550736 RepID=A0A3M6QZ71_9BURK|nr:DUF637 domain-containing protein [Corticibacter populi]RMX07832.1 filamentous hemagglutinin N-terminal domain-containing protein [Corticibacter populi]RZS35067.1 filamentous hemagglutinin [Corticibacter populi]